MSVTVTSLPGTLNYALVQGATFRSRLTYRANGLPVDLTSYTAKLQIRDSTGGTILAELTTENGITLGGSAGTIDLFIADTASNTFTPGIYVYDLQLTAASSDVIYLIEGKFDIQPRVTT